MYQKHQKHQKQKFDVRIKRRNLNATSSMISNDEVLFNMQLLFKHATKEELITAYENKLNSLFAAPVTVQSAEETGAKAVVQKKFKWSVASLDDNFKFDHSKAVGAVDLNAIDWSPNAIKGIERSDNGSEGLFFVQTTSGALVVKRSKAIGSELFCTCLALKLGIQSPLMRIVHTTDEYGIRMLMTLVGKDPMGRVRATLYEQNFLILMQYQRGRNLSALRSDSARVLTAPTLQQIGAILALDVLINNCDRLPLIWTHQGNAGNLMFDDDNNAVSIDGQIVGLSDADAIEYRSRIARLLSNLKSNVLTEFDNVRSALMSHCSHDVGLEGAQAMRDGFLQIVTLSKTLDLRQDLEMVYSLLSTMSPTLSDLPQIRVEFVLANWDMFRSH